MELDKEFVGAIVRGGKSAFLSALDRGIDREFEDGKHKIGLLAGEGLQAWKFIRAHYDKYDEIPSVDAIQISLNIALDCTMQETHEFFLDKILERRLFNVQKDGAKRVVDKLDTRDPVGAAEVWSEINRKIQEEALTEAKVESLLGLGKMLIADYKEAKAGKRGIPTPWPSMDNQTLGWWPEDLILFVGRMGSGKCVDEDTEIVDPVTGIPQTIKQLVTASKTSRVTTWGKERGVHAAGITAKVITGRKDCLRVTLRTGRSVILTPEHPLLTTSGWTKAEAFSVGMSIAIPSKMPEPEAPVQMDPAELDILAIILAEGSCTGNHVGFSTSDPEILRIATEAASEIGCTIKHRSDYDYDFIGRAESNRKHSVMRELLGKFGIDRTKAVDKILPEEVFSLSNKQLSRFLSIFWMCDGYVDSAPGITLASERMVMQIQSLLLRLGVQSSVRFKTSSCNGKKFSAWRLTVYAKSFSNFSDSLNLWGDKAKRASDLARSASNGFVGNPSVDAAFIDNLKSLVRNKTLQEGGPRLVDVGKAMGWTSKFHFALLFGRRGELLMNNFKTICKVFGLEREYSWMWDSDLFWDRIISIEPVGERNIYDLTVEPTSCFIGNDIVLHNTWTLINCAHKAWVAGHKVLLVSTEMSRKQMARRFFALHLRVPYDDLRRGRLGEFAESKFFQSVTEMLSDGGIDVTGGDFDYTIDNIQKSVADKKPELMLVDGAYLIKNTGKDRHERVSNTFDDFKKINKKTRVATIASLQFNRSAKTGDSSTINSDNIGITDVAGWNADAAYGLSQTEEQRNNCQMIVKGMKVREGSPDEFLVNWNHKTMDFSEIGTLASTPAYAPSNTGADAAFASDDDYEDVPF